MGSLLIVLALLAHLLDTPIALLTQIVLDSLERGPSNATTL